MSLKNLRKIYPGNKTRPFSRMMRAVLTEICRAGDTTTVSFRQNRTIRTLRSHGIISQDGIPPKEVIDFWLAEVEEQPYSPEERILAAINTLTDKQADGLDCFFDRGTIFAACVVRVLKAKRLIERVDGKLTAYEHVEQLWFDSDRRQDCLKRWTEESQGQLPKDFGKNRWNELGDLIHWGLTDSQLRQIRDWCDDSTISKNVLFGKVRQLTSGSIQRNVA